MISLEDFYLGGMTDEEDEMDFNADDLEPRKFKWKDETEELHAFTYQQTLIVLDTVFADQPPEECDAFIMAHEWDEEADGLTGTRRSFSPGEVIEPVRMTLTRQGNLAWIGRYWSEEDDDYIFMAMRTDELKDLMPKTYGRLSGACREPSLELFNKKNRDVIGSRLKVVDSLKTAIKVRSEANGLKEMERQEKERAASYRDDDEAGMF